MILIVGYGIMTSGIINNISSKSDNKIVLLSRHKKKLNGVIVKNQIDQINFDDIDLIFICFENEHRHKTFFKIINGMNISKNIIIVDMSTISSKVILNTYNTLSNNLKYVECPITGSKNGSELGELSAFIYHELDLNSWENLQKILVLFIKNIYIFDTRVDAMKFKLFYNAWGAYMLYSMRIFKINDLSLSPKDVNIAKIILKTDGWMSNLCKSKLDQINENEFDNVHFKLKYMIKDLQFALKEFHGSSYFLIETLLKQYEEIEKYGEYDFSIIAK